MSAIGEVRVLVEGYDDRAFWAGYLRQVLDCVASVDLSPEERRALPPGAAELLSQRRGTYTYLSRSRTRVVRVVPYQEAGRAEDLLWTSFDEAITGRATRPEQPLRGVVVCRDDDGLVGEPARHQRGHLVDRLRRLGESDRGGEAGVLLVDGVQVLPVTWRCEDPVSADLPDKQTLERVVCAALRQVWPERVASARAWLATRPDPSEVAADHKATAGALWAGWYARDGWAWFFEGLWREPGLREALLGRLPALASPEIVRLLS